MAGKVYRTKPEDGSDGRTGEVHKVPGIMEEVKLSRRIEKLRRERDKCQGSLEQEITRIKNKGLLAPNAALKILRSSLEAKEAELEDAIEEIVRLNRRNNA